MDLSKSYKCNIRHALHNFSSVVIQLIDNDSCNQHSQNQDEARKIRTIDNIKKMERQLVIHTDLTRQRRHIFKMRYGITQGSRKQPDRMGMKPYRTVDTASFQKDE